MTRLDRDRPDSLSVPEMLRIMDVATALRQDRELVEEQLDVEKLKERLKERMLAASKVTGEPVTPEEVDAAIRQYYAGLYTFREPKLGFSVALAHLWVRRKEIIGGGCVALLCVALLWWSFFSPNARFSASGRKHRLVESLSASIARQGENVRALSADNSLAPEVARLAAEAEVYRKKEDAGGLESVRKKLTEMETLLGEEYTVHVVSRADRKSAVDRYFKGEKGKKLSGYYLIVEARTSDGSVLTRRIHDDQVDSYRQVTTWGERVPEAVYERLKKDKQENGILNETAFAAKRKGSLDEEITMPGPDGKPLTRLGQITEW